MNVFKPKENKSLLDDNAANIRDAAVGYLRTHRNWYKTSTLIYGLLWNGLTLSIIALSATTSIIAAYDKSDEYKLLVVLLSAITALFGTLLVQFRVRDL